MNELKAMSELYVAIGAGGLSFIVLIFLGVYFVRNVVPVLQQIKEDNAGHKEIIKNNTEAIREMSRSNDNIATALTMVQASMDSMTAAAKDTAAKIERHDQRSERMENTLIEVKENAKRMVM